MTFSATSPFSTSFADVRAQLTFAVRDEPEAPGLAGQVRIRLAGLIGLAGLGVGLAALSVSMWSAAPPRAAPPTAPVTPVTAAPAAPAWIDVKRPFTAYDLAGSPYAKLPLTYTARRDAGGTARQDVLTYGTPLPGEAFLRLMFYRRGGEPAPTTTVSVDAARLAAGAGLAITRSGLTSELSTRFGAVDVAGVAVSRADRSGTCLAFRLADAATTRVLQFSGLACGTDEKPMDLATVGCAIEKLDLVSAGDDEDLRAVFVSAERRRGLGCREDRGAGVRPGWREAEPPVRSALKGPL